MKKIYPSFLGKLCLALLFSFLFVSFAHAQIRTYDTTFDGWNAIVTEDLSLHGNDSAPGIIFFPGIDQQTKNIRDLSVNGPHYLINNKMWDGSVTLGNGVHHPFIISLQPSAPSFPATVVKPKIDAILRRYRIKRNSLYFTGLSLGAWQANEFIAYQPTTGDHTYGRMVRAIVNLEGVEPADNTGVYASLAYPNKMGDWAKACGGRELWVEGSNDWRDMQAGADNMNAAVAGSATYFQVKYGGGAHCCWNTEYQPGVTWTKKSNSNITQVDGKEVPMNVWQWLLRQGDTTMPGGTPAAPVTAAPAVSAGSGQTITLPASSAGLKGSAAAGSGATIKALSWKQTQGPASSKIASPGSVSTNISGLTKAGSYVYTLTATDNKGKQASASVTVVVNNAPVASKPVTPSKPATPTPPPPPAAKPNVSAGSGPTITLPTTSATLNGSAAGANGAKIAGVSWQQSSGPAKARIASPGSLSTGISGLTAAGTYQFRMTVTDQNGKQAAAVVNVTVKPAPPVAKTPAPPVANTPPPTVSAGKGQTIAQPASQVTLQGTAIGTGGATIKALTWKQGSGPVTARIGSPTSLSTVVSGMTKTGSYIFTLTATDSKGKQASGSMTVVINAASATPPVAARPVTPATPPTVNAGGNQTITLPASSVGLNGTAAGGNGARITGVVWQQSQGPAKVKFSSSSSLSTSVTGLTAAGGYVFRLTVTDQNGKQAAAVTTVMVNPAPAVTNSPAPTVSAGQGQRISLPATQATLTGKATGNGGATIRALAWKQSSGPVAAKIGSPASISTAVSGMTAAGNYVFTLTATDSKGKSANGSVTVTIASGSAASTPSAKEPPAVSAGGNQTITLPANSVTLNGSASGRNGAVVNSYFWRLVSGPGWVTFGNEWAPSTTVGGLVAGTYVFEFEASDNNTETGTATVTVVVKPKPAKTVTGNTAVIGDAAMTDPSAADSINGVSGLVIYPNPVHDLLNLNVKNDMKGRIIVAIFGMNGTRLQTQELTKESWSLQTSVDVSKLAAGVYIVEIVNSTGGLPVSEKFIKQ